MRRRKRSKSHREAIGRATTERTLRRLAQETPQPTAMRCSKCGETKPLAEFYHRRRKLKSGVVVVEPYNPCRNCKIAETTEHREKLRADGVLAERRRRYELVEQERDREAYRARKRADNAAHRRREGVEPRLAALPLEDGEMVPTGPISAFLRERLKTETKDEIAARTGIDKRRLFDIEREEYSSRSIGVVDRLLTGLGCPEMLDELYPLNASEPMIGHHVLDPRGILTQYKTAA